MQRDVGQERAGTTATRLAGAAAAGPPRDFVGYGPHPPMLTWPGGAALAVNLVIVYEEGSEYSLVEGDGRNEAWGEYNIEVPGDVRDLGTETHFEYGSRAGIWRLARLLERFDVPATVSATALALERNPAVAEWMAACGHDLLGHGLRWTECYTMTAEEERRDLHAAIALYQKLLGSRPLGWNARSFPSVNTRALLVEEGGFLYESDACNDDLPYFIEVDGRRLLILPYSKTYNDSRFLIAPGYSTPGHFTANVCEAVDYLVEEAAALGGRMMTVAVHARWTGQANRAAALRRIVEHVRATPGAAFIRRLDLARHVLAHHADLPTLPLPGGGAAPEAGP